MSSNNVINTTVTTAAPLSPLKQATDDVPDAQTPSTVCLPSTTAAGTITGPKVCLPQALDPITGISLGLIVPQGTDVADTKPGLLPPDFIMAAWTPLPYGFAGVGGDDDGTTTPSTGNVKAASNAEAPSSPLTAAWWIEGVLGKFIPVVQIFEKSPTASALIRVANPSDGGATITISPLSSESSLVGTAFMLFRGKNCAIQTLNSEVSGSFKLATMISSTPPQYSTEDSQTSSESGLLLPLDAQLKRGSVVLMPLLLNESDYKEVLEGWGLN
ncbi:hypothetical protein BDN70DRAFT_916800 [Pholiota conissans]|uniref:Uncharacterized protein n=1 Tax=Pholiota conissans TaxID=109636 RepID=A0A9P5ZFG0_9AGAR|nr:hypothetical protein BDN70DRAFT_916800 [Pholiota conissans]